MMGPMGLFWQPALVLDIIVCMLSFQRLKTPASLLIIITYKWLKSTV